MTNKKYYLVFILIMVSLFSWATMPKDDKKKENEGATNFPNKIEGVVYSLPRTGFKIKVNVKKETFVPGPYSAYAKKYLGYADVRKVANVKWAITGIEVETFAESDPEAMFKTMDSIASRLTLMPDGRIIGMNTQPSSTSQDFIGSSYITTDDVPEIAFPDQASSDFFDILLDSTNGSEKMVPKSLELMAQETAEYLIRVRKKRAYTILSPSDAVPEDGNAYIAFLEEAKMLEAEYVALFAGKTFTSNFEYSFNFIPGNVDVKNEVIFRFSEDKGVLPTSDITGKPIFIEISRDKIAYSNAEKLKNSENAEANTSGLFYRIPVVSEFAITNGLSTLYSGRVAIAQMGSIAPVPVQFINNRFSISFDTSTGNIKGIVRK